VDDAPHTDLQQLGNAGTPEERRTGLGGSDAAAALGLSPWRSPFDLWEEKVGQAPPVEQNEPMLWGKLLEDIIRGEYARRTGYEVRYRQDMIRHPVRAWQFAHLDGEVGQDGRRILEVKSARMPFGWGEPETDEIPLPYLVQVHHSLMVTAAEVCDVAVLIGGSDFRIYQVRRDIEIEQQLIEGEAAFWDSVTQGVPPAPKTLEDAVKRWGHLDATGYIVAGDAELRAIEILRRSKGLRREIEEAEKAAEFTIKMALGANGLNLVHPGGELLATWKLDNGRKAYSVEAREPSRRFLVKHLEDV
jgi:putative phage-type endonuclease